MNVGKSTVYEAFHDIVDTLYETRHEFIKFPMTVAETAQLIATFDLFRCVVVGAIDGTHMKIKASKESAVDYYSHYQQHDVVLQGVVNGWRLFIDVATAFQGICMTQEYVETVTYFEAQKSETFYKGRYM